MSASASSAPAPTKAKRGALTFGTRMAAAGAPLRTIQEWMGHRDYKTTEIYADYAPDPVQGARWAEAAFAEEEDDDDGDATDDEKEAS